MRCGYAWATQQMPVVVGGIVLSDGSETRREHVCGAPLDVSDDPPIHWGLHECADAGCGEATSMDVYDPDGLFDSNGYRRVHMQDDFGGYPDA